jgi:ABC-2 type transport system ATP-binding protein
VPEIIRVENLSKSFSMRRRTKGFFGAVKNLFYAEKSQLNAVDCVSFSIRQGELVGYLGPNGAGKSTTIKMLTGILRPTSGKIHVAGIDNPQDRRKKLTRRIGVVFGQKTQLWWDLPVQESFDLLRTIYRIPAGEFKQRMEFFSELLGLKDFLEQQTRKLSLGQRMRADLAASLLHKPPVLFLDEPTIGLDILTREAIRKFIKDLNEKEKTTILLTTHDMQDVEFLANRLILIDHGAIHYDGQLKDFTARMGPEKIVTVHLEKPLPDLQVPGFSLKLQHSDLHYEFQADLKTSLGPLIDAIVRAGSHVAEISVRHPDLEDTLKAMYGNSRAEL